MQWERKTNSSYFRASVQATSRTTNRQPRFLRLPKKASADRTPFSLPPPSVEFQTSVATPHCDDVSTDHSDELRRFHFSGKCDWSCKVRIADEAAWRFRAAQKATSCQLQSGNDVKLRCAVESASHKLSWASKTHKLFRSSKLWFYEEKCER